MEKQRSSFTSKLGFVLAAAGSAVGLGNLWRFPYLTAKYGGGMFLLIYLILAVTFGFSLMVAEISLGRNTGLSAIGAFEKLNKKYAFLGVLNSLVPMIITAYYCVIGGWVLKFLFSYITSPAAAVSATSAEGLTLFERFISNPIDPLLWWMIFLVLTMIIVILGVEKGIEKSSKILMPLLVIIVIIVTIYACTRPGAIEGIKYVFIPKIEDFSPVTVLAAMTQLFFSLSLAMGIMITYGSYMKKDENIETCTFQIEAFDTGVAILAALIIIPTIFSCGRQGDLKSGPSLIFIVLPELFTTMTWGRVVAILFFFLVFFAAITSSVSLFETVVSIINDKTKKGRNFSIVIALIICIIIGALSSLGYGPLANVTILGMQFLDLFDFLSNNVLMPVVALFTCIFVGYVIKPRLFVAEVEEAAPFKLKKLFIVIIRYVAPVLIFIILIASILQGFGLLKI